MKGADRPHRVTIYLSLGAIIISIGAGSISVASWYEAHQSRKIAAAASKAVVSAISVKTEAVEWVYTTSQLDLAVANLGRSVAKNVIIKYKYSFVGAGGSVPEQPTAPMLIESLASGASYNFHVHIFTEQSSLNDQFAPKQLIDFTLRGSVLYRDTATDSVDEQPFCFSTWMNGPRLPMSTAFRTCNEHQRDFTIYDNPTP
jgi:hypothetical protein